ncbi:MAG: DNA polymerase III subunit gamma/tau [Chthonomonadales bacterium]|nr:DNA polymerase III subunit gamma/tau [Chthonomonadales bacterium]
MAYVSLYRKYRSQNFTELIGQDHVTTVLRNSLRQQRYAHAYLFCGPRGCGKTSAARLLARALNCESSTGPTPDPCGTCSTCERIRSGSSIDVVEMDAASETGIDDVREKIIENTRFGPVEGRCKVYIIDEVHDLSQKAFDSLLKTIEEPPANVVFILATTEAHKVPPTIRSRCQRFDFRRGSLDALTANLERVLQAEGLEWEKEAAYLIARAAEGSFRDSLSLLEQVIAVADGPITETAVRESLGAIGRDTIDAAMRAIRDANAIAAFEFSTTILASGADVRQALAALQEHIRDILVVAYTGSVASLQGMPPEHAETLREQSGWFTPARLLELLAMLAEAERDLRFSNQHRIILERTLWRMAEPTERPAVSVAPPAREALPIDTNPADSRADRAAPVRAVPSVTDDQGNAARAARDVGITLDILKRIWPRVRSRIIDRSRSAAGVLTDDVTVADLEHDTVSLAFQAEFARARADRPNARAMIEQVFADELGVAGLKVRCIVAPDSRTAAKTRAETPSAATEQPSLLETTARTMDGVIVSRDDESF